MRLQGEPLAGIISRMPSSGPSLFFSVLVRALELSYIEVEIFSGVCSIF